MRKGLFRFMLLAAVGLIAFQSCEKDEMTDLDKIIEYELAADSLNYDHQLTEAELLAYLANLGYSYNDSINNRIFETDLIYTLNLVDAATSSIKSTNAASSMEGAVVTITQGGVVFQQIADATGLLIFTDMTEGISNVNIQFASYSDVNYTFNIDELEHLVSSLVPMIPIEGSSLATIKGVVYYESDLTNQEKEVASDVAVMVKVSLSDYFSNQVFNEFDAFSYGNLNMSDTTNTVGEYEFLVPSTADGLDYDIYVNDFEDNQKLLLENVAGEIEVKTVSTIFGHDVTTSTVDELSSVKVEVSAPDYAPTTEVVATAILQNVNGVEAVNVTDNGSLYTDGQYYIAIEDLLLDDEATATVYVSNGVVSAVTVNNQGAGYAPTNTIDLGYQQTEFKATIGGVDGTGAIQWINISDDGYFLSKKDIYTVVVDDNTGADADLSINWSGNNIGSLNIDDAGSGYTAGSDIMIVVSNNSTEAAGNLVLTTAEVIAFTVQTPGIGYNDDFTYKVELTGGGGEGATANYNITDQGVLDYITIDNNGSGYTSAPTVNVVLDAELTNAAITVDASDLDQGKIEGLNLDEAGMGYIADPTITISQLGVTTTGTGAEFGVVVNANGTIVLSISEEGAGYFGNYPNKVDSDDNKKVYNIPAGAVKIVNFNLGAGERVE